MRNLFFVILLVCLCGCVPSNAKKLCTENKVLAKQMVTLVEEGKTTRVQEQEFIKATADLWAKFDAALNGEKDESEKKSP